MLAPSIFRSVGIFPPASVAKVGMISNIPKIASVFVSGAICPGHQAIVGTRIPPSQVLPLFPRSGLLTARGVPPLSLVKRTKVFSLSPNSRRVSSTRAVVLWLLPKSGRCSFASPDSLPSIRSDASSRCNRPVGTGLRCDDLATIG